MFSFLWRPHKLVIAFCFEDNFSSWNGGILAFSFSSHPMHVSNVSFFLSFFLLLMNMFGGHSAASWSKTPEVLFPISSLASLCSLYLSLFLSHTLYLCLIRLFGSRNTLDLSVLSALCIWMALCARLGL